ncbi:MAG: DUF3775 domain-containing protein [Pseudomonadota bacterium]
MLSLSLTTVAWIIQRAREFDVRVPADTPEDEGDNPLGPLVEREGDALEAELTAWIEDLTDTQRAELVAIFWLGRDDEDASEFPALVQEARDQQGRGTARYLLGSPMLPDYVEAGLERLGIDVTEVESAVA